MAWNVLKTKPLTFFKEIMNGIKFIPNWIRDRNTFDKKSVIVLTYSHH